MSSQKADATATLRARKGTQNTPQTNSTPAKTWFWLELQNLGFRVRFGLGCRLYGLGKGRTQFSQDAASANAGVTGGPLNEVGWTGTLARRV